MHSRTLIPLLLALAAVPNITARPFSDLTTSNAVPRPSHHRSRQSLADSVRLASNVLVRRADSDSSADSTGVAAAAEQFMADVQAAVTAGDETELNSVIDDFAEAMKADMWETADACGAATASNSDTLTTPWAISTAENLVTATPTVGSGTTTTEIVALTSMVTVSAMTSSKAASSGVSDVMTASTTVQASTTPVESGAAPAWTSGVYKQVSTAYSGRNGTAIDGKAGIAFSSASSGDNWAAWDAVPGNNIGWGFNWGTSVSNSFPTTQWEFVPQMWSAGSSDAIQAGILTDFGGVGVTTLLSVNEPDNAGQANLTPAAAAALHQKVFTQEVAAKYRIGAPAVQFGGEQWFKDWLDACQGKCLFDFIPLHTYFTDPTTVQTYVEQFHDDIGLNIWLTEYACQNWVNWEVVYCTAEDQVAFTKTINSWAYETEWMERYSQFGAFENLAGTSLIALMNADGSPNALAIDFITAT